MKTGNTTRLMISHKHLVDSWLKEKGISFRTSQERNGEYTHHIEFPRHYCATEIWHLAMEFNEWKAIYQKTKSI